MRAVAVSSSEVEAAPPLTTARYTTAHSPVPYLFGGLAAMLGLISFSLLVLACSYWKLHYRRHLEEEAAAAAAAAAVAEKPVVFQEKVFVIMAGDSEPRYLATPILSKVSPAAVVGGGDGGDGEEKVAEGR